MLRQPFKPANMNKMMIEPKTALPFPSQDEDELFARYGIVPRVYTDEQLETAATSWKKFMVEGMNPELYLRLVAVCEGSLSEATVIWDALRTHRKRGLVKYIDRSASDYTSKYGVICGVGRTYNRALTDLVEQQIIVRLPIVQFNGYRFRLDWVELSNRLNAAQALVIPGLDEDTREVMQ